MLAGAPVHLSKILNKYTSVDSLCVVKKTFTRSLIKNLNWDYDFVAPNKKLLHDLFDWADLIHFHQSVYCCINCKGRSLIQYHAEPVDYQAFQTHAAWNGKKLVIAQYHPLFYSDASIVPNMIDIWAPQYCPGPKPADRVKIFYSWAFDSKKGWGRKGSQETMKILQQIQKRYPGFVQLDVLTNAPYEKCLAEKRDAHICIDECVTGSYHLQSLEGCSVGAATINNLSRPVLKNMQAVSQTSSHPFVCSDISGLFDLLCDLIEHPDKLFQLGQRARAWMEKYWDPRTLVNLYLKHYEKLLTLKPQTCQ
jgi:hypothetical protein